MHLLPNLSAASTKTISRQLVQRLSTLRLKNSNEAVPAVPESKPVLENPKTRYSTSPQVTTTLLTRSASPSDLEQAEQKSPLLFARKFSPGLGRNITLCSSLSCSNSIHSRKFSTVSRRLSSPIVKAGTKFRKYSSFKEMITNRLAFFRKKSIPHVPLDNSTMKMQIVTDKIFPGKTTLQLYPVSMEKQVRLTPMASSFKRNSGSSKANKPSDLVTIVDLCNRAKMQSRMRWQQTPRREPDEEHSESLESQQKDATVSSSADENEAAEEVASSSTSQSRHWGLSLSELNEKNEANEPDVEVQQSSAEVLSKVIEENEPPTALNLKAETDENELYAPDVEEKPNRVLYYKVQAAPEIEIAPTVRHEACKIVAGKRPCPICYSTAGRIAGRLIYEKKKSQAFNENSETERYVNMQNHTMDLKRHSSPTKNEGSTIGAEGTSHSASYSTAQPPYKIATVKRGEPYQTDAHGRLCPKFHTNVVTDLPVEEVDAETSPYSMYHQFPCDTHKENSPLVAEENPCPVCLKTTQMSNETALYGYHGKIAEGKTCPVCCLNANSLQKDSSLCDLHKKESSTSTDTARCPICHLNHRPFCNNSVANKVYFPIVYF